MSTVNMLCREIGCSMRAMYAEKTGDCPRYCLKHKKPGHLHVYNQCQHPGCALRPLFGRMLRSQARLPSHAIPESRSLIRGSMGT